MAVTNSTVKYKLACGAMKRKYYNLGKRISAVRQPIYWQLFDLFLDHGRILIMDKPVRIWTPEIYPLLHKCAERRWVKIVDLEDSQLVYLTIIGKRVLGVEKI